MLFNSLDFLVFFPVVVIIYYLIPCKIRYIWLLACSYFFYMGWRPRYALILLATTGVTYVCGLMIEWAAGRTVEEQRKRLRIIILVAGIGINLGILGYYKYFNFTIGILNTVIEHMHLGKSFSVLDIVLPVGISFYIFQALGYLIDVYRGDIYAERNFLRYALFVSFFPQLVAGPIERSKNLLVQLSIPVRFSYENIRKGFLLMLWGFFLKLVIADRAAVIVNAVYGNSYAYPGVYIVFATFLFAMQIYCDFHGYSTIARGAALVMGITLTDNFKAPYFATSVKEFWRRWHISLTSWFRDYLYIPLGGNRKGNIRKEINLLFVFGVSGLWHGAAFTYIIWGVLNGLYQVAGGIYVRVKKVLYEWKNKLFERYKVTAEELREAGIGTLEEKGEKAAFSKVLRGRVITFLLVSFAWMFFRADSLSAVAVLLKNLLVFNLPLLFEETIYLAFGMQRLNFIVLLLSIILLFIVDAKKDRGEDVAALFFRQEWWLRGLLGIGLLYVIILFGCYGEMYDVTEFLYFQF